MKLTRALERLFVEVSLQTSSTDRERWEKSQWLEPSILLQEEHQNLQKMLKHARTHVPEYRHALEKNNCKETQLSDWPILTKDIIRRAGPNLLAEETANIRTVERRTSGSTMRAAPILLQKEALAAHHAARSRSLNWYNIERGEPGILLWGISSDLQNQVRDSLKDLMLNTRTFSTHELPDSCEEILRTCQNLAARYLYGYPSALTQLARFVLKNGKPRLKFKAVITTAEPLFNYQRRLMEEAFECPVANEYGATEVGVIAFECPQHRLHITSENVHLEISEKEGLAGEILVTSLKNYAMPFIRYRLGDWGRISQEKTCPCGRGLPLLENILGRDDDWLIMPNNQRIFSDVIDKIHQAAREEKLSLPDFKLFQTSRNTLDIVTTEINSKCIRFLLDQLEKRTPQNIHIHIKYVPRLLPETSGKMRFIATRVSWPGATP